MPHRLLSPADYRRMRWRNGGGHTTEIAAHPPGAKLEAFDWRVSIASIERDGPFSRYPGVDRILVLLSGEGLRLAGGGNSTEVRAVGDPCTFDGDVPLHCTLFRGPVRSFNLMVRRARLRGEVQVVRDEHATVAPARFRVVHVHAGAYECLLPARPPIRVDAGHTLVVEADGAPPTLDINPVAAGSLALIATAGDA